MIFTRTRYSRTGPSGRRVRVKEAWRQGLDVIAVTDHVEYQPHKDDVPTNHDRPYELAAGRAKEMNLLLPKGAEITRDTPPGHFNAIFLEDVARLETEGFVDAVKRANEQGAFVFWNHHGWKGPEKGRWLEAHTTSATSISGCSEPASWGHLDSPCPRGPSASSSCAWTTRANRLNCRMPPATS